MAVMVVQGVAMLGRVVRGRVVAVVMVVAMAWVKGTLVEGAQAVVGCAVVWVLAVAKVGAGWVVELAGAMVVGWVVVGWVVGWVAEGSVVVVMVVVMVAEGLVVAAGCSKQGSVLKRALLCAHWSNGQQARTSRCCAT
jgi:hypothetical protein